MKNFDRNGAVTGRERSPQSYMIFRGAAYFKRNIERSFPGTRIKGKSLDMTGGAAQVVSAVTDRSAALSPLEKVEVLKCLFDCNAAFRRTRCEPPFLHLYVRR